jgi:hypothetical protein
MAGESRGEQIAAIGYTFAAISSVATILRIYCRGWVIRAFGADDWLAVIAQVFISFLHSAYASLTSSSCSLLSSVPMR